MSKKIYPIRKSGRFYFTECHKLESFWRGTIPTFIQSLIGRSKRMREAIIEPWVAQGCPVQQSFQPHITWLGHATFLIQLGGLNILTDPIFGDASFLFPRVLPIGVSLDQLPPIDVIIISHNHHDHMDEKSLKILKKLSPDAAIMVPWGDKNWFDRRGYVSVNEFSWWEDAHVAHKTGDYAPVRFTFLPSAHWSQRGLFDKNKSLWGSWMIEWNGSAIYFAGDTAYAHHFASIGHHFPAIDVALMPIGPCEPHEWMSHTHVNAEQAGQAFLDLKAQQFIPMHWGTFIFGYDHFELPVQRIKNWWESKNDELHGKKLHVCKVGESIDIAIHSDRSEIVREVQESVLTPPESSPSRSEV